MYRHRCMINNDYGRRAASKNGLAADHVGIHLCFHTLTELEILERVFCTPVNVLCSSSDSLLCASSKLPNTYVCHRTISSEHEFKECGVRECTATGTCCSRCATKIEESKNTVCRDSNASSDLVSKKLL